MTVHAGNIARVRPSLPTAHGFWRSLNRLKALWGRVIALKIFIYSPPQTHGPDAVVDDWAHPQRTYAPKIGLHGLDPSHRRTGQSPAKFTRVWAVEKIRKRIMAWYTVLQGHETAKNSFLFAAKLIHVGTGFTNGENSHQGDHQHFIKIMTCGIAVSGIPSKIWEGGTASFYLKLKLYFLRQCEINYPNWKLKKIKSDILGTKNVQGVSGLPE